ncbi:MAG: stage II sporulation protein P [Lachnospiraceae bacterium]|nr:stage II sporulation protein P [Lachnospiraceae bacterium]
MRKNSRLQKLLYCVMAVLGAYILYKGGSLLAAGNQLQKALSDGSVQQSLEDSAMRTWATAYTATVEGKRSAGWFSQWIRQIAPVFSYAVDRVESESESENWNLAEDRSGEVKQVESETEYGSISDASENTSLEQTYLQGEQDLKNQEGNEGQAENQELEPLTELITEEELDADMTAQETAVGTIFSQALPQLLDFSYLLSNIYSVDADTRADAELLDAGELLSMDLSLEQDSSVPQILIYHTHSQEAFADSVEGEVSDTVVGMGEVLSDELRAYGYNVIHDTGVYDLVDGVLDRSAAYDYARASIGAILEEYPTIEVIIDLHRDGVDGSEEDFVTEIDGEAVSRIMFFNGLSRDANGEDISWLPNENRKENLAFSLQLQVLANAEYPGFTRKIYLQSERYNLHLRARSLLIEAGTQLNTVEEERNAMAPIANLIRQILA